MDEHRMSVADRLTRFGIDPDVAQDLASEATMEIIEDWIAYIQEPRHRVHSPQGFLVYQLRNKRKAPQFTPSVRRSSKKDRYRYLRGKHADHVLS